MKITKENINELNWMEILFLQNVVKLRGLGLTEEQAKEIVKAAMNKATEII